MPNSISPDYIKEKVELGILKIAKIKPSTFTPVDVIWLHRWVDGFLVPYLEKLEKGQLGQQEIER